MLESLKVGLSEGAGERLNRSYAYSYFGDVAALTEDTTNHSFTNDGRAVSPRQPTATTTPATPAATAAATAAPTATTTPTG